MPSEIFRDHHPDRKETEPQRGRVAFIFPGQGSQVLGMGRDLYKNSPSAQRVFQTIDDVLEISLSRIIFEGPEQELAKTVHSQPAIFAVSLAAVAATREQLGDQFLSPVVMAGHSLGEYTALAVSGALSVEDAARLVKERGRLMQQASELSPGGMSAILGIDETILEEICQETGAKIANINTPDQIVISGDRLSLARAMDLATARGAHKTIPLAVSGAFHSNLMHSAQEGLNRTLQGVRFRRPEVPIVANVTAEPITTVKAVKEELLAQLCNCVQWRASVDYMVGNAGVRSFVEFGPGRILSNMVGRISREAKVTSVNGFESITTLGKTK